MGLPLPPGAGRLLARPADPLPGVRRAGGRHEHSAAQSGIKVGLSVEGHAGYTPGAITEASLSYSYDGGTTWITAPTQKKDGKWTAVLDHTGATGKQVMTKAEFTDANGNAVTQTITRAYDVR